MKGTGRVNTFLVEIIVVILFFSLSAAVTLQVFAATHTKGQQSVDLNKAVTLAQQLTEQYRADGDQNEWCTSPELEGKNTIYTLQYDKDWNPVQQTGKYLLEFTVSALSEDVSGTMYQYNVRAVLVGETEEQPDETVVYELTSEHYRIR